MLIPNNYNKWKINVMSLYLDFNKDTNCAKVAVSVLPTLHRVLKLQVSTESLYKVHLRDMWWKRYRLSVCACIFTTIGTSPDKFM